MPHFPEHLAKHSKQSLGIFAREPEAAQQATDHLLFIFAFGIAAGHERFIEQLRQPFQVGRSSCHNGLVNRWPPGHSRNFIQAYCHRLPQVHRRLLGLRGDSDQPVAVTEVFIRKAPLFGTEQEGDFTALQFAAEETGAFPQRSQRMIELAVPSSGCSEDKRTVRNRIGYAGKLFRTPE